MITRSNAFKTFTSGVPEVMKRVTSCPFARSKAVYFASGALVNPTVAAAAEGWVSDGWKLTHAIFALVFGALGKMPDAHCTAASNSFNASGVAEASESFDAKNMTRRAGAT